MQLSELLVGDGAWGSSSCAPRSGTPTNDARSASAPGSPRSTRSQVTIELEDGEQIEYRKLALATGSQPVMPSIPGLDLPGVHPYRDPEHCEAIREAACGEVEHAAVIGGGLLGLEAARGIQAQGCPVTVVHIVDRLMGRMRANAR